MAPAPSPPPGRKSAGVPLGGEYFSSDKRRTEPFSPCQVTVFLLLMPALRFHLGPGIITVWPGLLSLDYPLSSWLPTLFWSQVFILQCVIQKPIFPSLQAPDSCHFPFSLLAILWFHKLQLRVCRRNPTSKPES